MNFTTAILVLSLSLTECPEDYICEKFEGIVHRGERYEQKFGPDLTFSLEPSPQGWNIYVRDERPDENIARLTGPFHFVPNPRYVEGWHFRNSQNTGPNDGSVNAPQYMRDFLYSPEVGRTFFYPLSASEAEQFTMSAGRGVLIIEELSLGNLVPGERAWIESMKFSLELSWPSSWEAQ